MIRFYNFKFVDISAKVKTFGLNTEFGVLFISILLLSLPVVIDLVTGGITTPFRYFAADSFYYFTVARNFAVSGILTFDQVHPTNGFHPLWQLFTGFLYKISLIFGISETSYLVIILCVSMLFTSLGLTFVGLTFIKSRQRLPASFILTPVGIYALLILPVWVYSIDFKGYHNQLEGPTPLYGTMWSFMNGMESSLTIFFFGLLFMTFTKYTETSLLRTLVFGLIASLFVLSRLDHFFITLGILLLLGLKTLTYRDRMSVLRLLVFTVGLAVPIIIYLAVNYAYAKAIMPVSASAKSTFPIPTLENLYYLVFVLLNPFSDHKWLDRFYRVTQIVIPSIAVIFALQWIMPFSRSSSKTRPLDNIDTFLLATGIGVLGLASYNFFFVDFYGPGHWYFPISILYTTLVFVNIIDRQLKPILFQKWKPLLYCSVCVIVFFVLHRRVGYHENYIRFYFDEARKIQNYYQGDPPKIIEYDDGIIAFSTGFPTMSGFGFALDQEAFIQLEKGNLTELAFERGFDRVTSLSYKNFSQTWSEDPEMIWFLPVENFTFSIEYVSPDDFFGIIRIYKRESQIDN